MLESSTDLLKHGGSPDALKCGTLCTAWKDGRLVTGNTEKSSLAIHFGSFNDNLSARILWQGVI